MTDCIFCKIVAGDIPCTKVYEDEVCLAFMDIMPLATGHVLVIPKHHYPRLTDMPGEVVAHIGGRLPELAAAMKKALGAGAMNLLQNDGRAAGQAVFHVHFHLIPRCEDDGLGYRWAAKPADVDRLASQAEAIRGELGA